MVAIFTVGAHTQHHTLNKAEIQMHTQSDKEKSPVYVLGS